MAYCNADIWGIQSANVLLRTLKRNIEYENGQFDSVVEYLSEKIDEEDEDRFAVVNHPFSSNAEERSVMKDQLENFIFNLNE